MSFLCFMDEPIATPLDEEVREFLAKLPAGEDRVGCNYLWFAFEHDHPIAITLGEFEAAAARVWKTSMVYGVRFIEDVDAKEVRRFYLEVFR